MLTPVYPKRQLRKHITCLVDAAGRMTAHETSEHYPASDPRRNKNVWGVDLNLTGQRFEKAVMALQALFQRELPSMMAPDLSGRMLLTFPVLPSELSSVLQVRGKEAAVPPELTSIKVIEPSELPDCKSRVFLALRRARTLWHGEGILLRSTDGKMHILVSNKLIDSFIDPLIKGLSIPKSLRKKDFFRMTCKHEELMAAKQGSEHGHRLKNQSALAAVSTNMLIWQTGLKSLFDSESTNHE